MTQRSQIPFRLSAIAALVLAASTALAQDKAEPEEEAIYRPLQVTALASPDVLLSEYRGTVELGLGYTSDDNFMFGRYNGLQEDGATLIGNLNWQDFSGDSNWRVTLSDLGLDTREGEVTWQNKNAFKLSLGFDSQQQVNNNSGATPFRGSGTLTLPDEWVYGSTTGDFSELQASLNYFDQEITRDKLFANLSTRLGDRWHLSGGLSYEQKEGTGDISGAMYTDAASGDAAYLPMDIDYETTEFDIGLSYAATGLNLEARLDYSDFNNQDDILIWENPYRSRTPDSMGGMSLAPDNDQLQGRITGQYIITPTARLQFDGSYAVASQDNDYLAYSVNPNAVVTTPLPRESFDGEAQTGTLNAKLWLRPINKLDVELFYKGRERDYDNPRDGYTYIRGDGLSQPRDELTVYNTSHHYQSQIIGLETTWRLPKRTRFTFEYEYEKEERENAAVEETEEDRVVLGLRAQPLDGLTARLEFGYANRAADTYNWDQRYYALLDVELINATPDSQRYINHPELSQYHLSNRERTHGKLDLSWLPTDNWLLNFNMLLQADDYDKSYLGLRDAAWERYHLSASYTAVKDVTATLYGGFDRYETEQMGRAFRGGAEKNAFEIYQPLPQASDPDRDWQLDAGNDAITVGANIQWMVADDLKIEADYSYVDTEGDQTFKTYGAADLNPEDLPTVETTLHHLNASGTWHMRKDLSFKLQYQYYNYESNDWALEGVALDSIDNVLTFGAYNPDEDIHYVGVSALYRWQ
ncbi:MtrB/PioB family decaheme-associated outer membrane protein [Halioglobus maricola]|uniref:MtrB/PioB family decaheme-associated outer membrane protein n=1 Tax=Halioglobus maricola TaxID=2601894 RepID=A0A5P9NNH2_9GAMM|nr:MtrB/PioB family decaheme-associated outer membrane protein [Halioglobus maricola]QFU76814.1 MtrB/PioB family decaheme-associated outer membrane protein [Halioglobus maricola]